MKFGKEKAAMLRMTPSDFYKFRHRTGVFVGNNNKPMWTTPMWIVGVSPFDPVLSPDDGYVVHEGAPRFIARWSLRDDLLSQVEGQRHVFDEDLNLLIYEVSFRDAEPEDAEEWLFEALCAVAYSKGMICELEPMEQN